MREIYGKDSLRNDCSKSYIKRGQRQHTYRNENARNENENIGRTREARARIVDEIDRWRTSSTRRLRRVAIIILFEVIILLAWYNNYACVYSHSALGPPGSTVFRAQLPGEALFPVADRRRRSSSSGARRQGNPDDRERRIGHMQHHHHITTSPPPPPPPPLAKRQDSLSEWREERPRARSSSVVTGRHSRRHASRNETLPRIHPRRLAALPPLSPRILAQDSSRRQRVGRETLWRGGVFPLPRWSRVYAEVGGRRVSRDIVFRIRASCIFIHVIPRSYALRRTRALRLGRAAN